MLTQSLRDDKLIVSNAQASGSEIGVVESRDAHDVGPDLLGLNIEPKWTSQPWYKVTYKHSRIKERKHRFIICLRKGATGKVHSHRIPIS